MPRAGPRRRRKYAPAGRRRLPRALDRQERARSARPHPPHHAHRQSRRTRRSGSMPTSWPTCSRRTGFRAGPPNSAAATRPARSSTAEWRYYGGDAGSTKYSPLEPDRRLEREQAAHRLVVEGEEFRTPGRVQLGSDPADGRRTPVLHRGHAARCRGAGCRHRRDAVDVPPG